LRDALARYTGLPDPLFTNAAAGKNLGPLLDLARRTSARTQAQRKMSCMAKPGLKLDSLRQDTQAAHRSSGPAASRTRMLR